MNTIGVIGLLCASLFGICTASPLDTDRPALIEAEPRAELVDYRLNDDVWPSHYDIEITPYFDDPEQGKDAFTFDGIATIVVQTATQGVTNILLHKANIEISSWFIVLDSNSTPVPHQDAIHNEETDVLTLPLNVALTPNVDYKIIFNYVGQLDEDMRGFYRSYYLVDGRKVWMGTTQFEQTDARRAFPCFDEPRFKATFKLTMNRNVGHQTYSNTPIDQTSNLPNGRVREVFRVTPIMSSYLLAFIVADYQLNFNEGMGILARPQAMNQTEYSRAFGVKVLKALGDWIEYPYSNVPEMTRMYMAAIPDFSAGAMENWGLLTYRETNILYSADDATSLQQQRIAAVIAHEIAHQWFGDLVTCEWWDVTWMNEGFARYFQFFGTVLVESEWDLVDQFVVEQLQGVMQMDSLESSHPMTHQVYTQAQASAIFDNISYNKGAVVLRMMEHYLGTETLRTGLAQYIKNRAYQATRPQYLFDALNAKNANAQSIMEPWTVQVGYPMVTVVQTDVGFTLTQRRFLVEKIDHTDETLWPLPITYATTSTEFQSTRPIIMTAKTHVIPIANVGSLNYFILNNQQVGYYRVNYDAQNWDKISKALRSDGFGGIHVLNRAQIVDDLFNFARGGVVQYDVALNILQYLKQETEYAPWLAAVNGLTTLARRIHEDDEELFASYIVELFSKAYDLVKFQAPATNERRVFTYLRNNVLQWACNYGHEGCKNATVAEFDRVVNGSTQHLHPDLRQVVYCEGIRQGKDANFNYLWNRLLTTNVATEQILILQGLGCAATKEHVFKVMDAISSDVIRSQDKSNAFTYLVNNAYTYAHVSQYLQLNHERWAKAHGSYWDVASAFNTLLGRMKNDDQMFEVKFFADTNRATLGMSAYETIKTGLETYKKNQEFTMRHRSRINNFLENMTKGSATRLVLNLTAMFGLLALVLLR